MVGVDVDQDGAGWSSLHHAAFHGDCGKIHSELERGINIDVKSMNSDTPLHMAAVSPWSDVATVEYLVAAGANVFARDRNGDFPIDNILMNTKKGYDKAIILHSMMGTLIETYATLISIAVTTNKLQLKDNAKRSCNAVSNAVVMQCQTQL